MRIPQLQKRVAGEPLFKLWQTIVSNSDGVCEVEWYLEVSEGGNLWGEDCEGYREFVSVEEVCK